MGHITENNVPDRRAIYAQFILGFVSFQIEHPDEGNDAAAAYQAGFASCLSVYRLALQRNAANRIPFLDGLSEQERRGTLAQHVEHLVTTRLVDRRKQ